MSFSDELLLEISSDPWRTWQDQKSVNKIIKELLAYRQAIKLYNDMVENILSDGESSFCVNTQQRVNQLLKEFK